METEMNPEDIEAFWQEHFDIDESPPKTKAPKTKSPKAKTSKSKPSKAKAPKSKPSKAKCTDKENHLECTADKVCNAESGRCVDVQPGFAKLWKLNVSGRRPAVGSQETIRQLQIEIGGEIIDPETDATFPTEGDEEESVFEGAENLFDPIKMINPSWFALGKELGLKPKKQFPNIDPEKYKRLVLASVREFERARKVNSPEEDDYNEPLPPVMLYDPKTGEAKPVTKTRKPRQPSRSSPAKRKEQEQDELETVFDVFAKPVTDDLRTLVRSAYMRVLSEAEENASPTKKQSPLRRKVVEEIETWEAYKEREYQKWRRAKYYDVFASKIPHDQLVQDTNLKIREMSDPVLIVQGIVDRHGEDVFDLDGTSFRERISKNKEIMTSLDAHMVVQLTMLPQEKLLSIRGRPLALELSLIIDRYIQDTLPYIDGDSIYKRLVHSWIQANIDSVPDSDKDRQEFASQYEETLRGLFDEYRKSLDSRTPPPPSPTKEQDFVELEKAKDIEDAVKHFENIVYLETAGDVHTGSVAYDYLSRVLFPLIFLENSNVGRYSKFFKAKVGTGEFSIRDLASMNLANMFPELLLNHKLTKPKFDQAIRRIYSELMHTMFSVAIDYIARNDPTRKIKDLQRRLVPIPGGWESYVIDPRSRCERDTNTGKVYVRDEEGYVEYSVEANGEAVPKKEDIPYSDLVICLDKDDGKFSCHSIDEVLRAIAMAGSSEQVINEVTGKPYPAKFISKMRNRYGNRLADPALHQKLRSPEPPKDVFMYELFGRGGDEE